MEHYAKAVGIDVRVSHHPTNTSDAYWTDEETVMECLLDPRCVRPEDYVPAENPKYRFNLDKIPQEQLGRMPAWRIHATTFVSTSESI